ncbi:MAG: CotS family spore coat protein [Firmicutes bacterium]|nr:CotS family spore coat protein [Bacillota bacterium]
MGRKRKKRHSGFQSMLDQYRILQSIADDYDLRMLQFERENGVFRVNTSQGLKKVKVFKRPQAELEYVHGALEHLAGKGWKRSMPFHLTREGLPYVETPLGLFYVCNWVQGTEINPEDPFHLEMAAKVIGEMHRLLQDYRGSNECHRQHAPNWQEKYGRQAEDLERYRQQAESARKGKFGRRFCQVADDFIRMMGMGLQLLDEADYDKVREEPEFVTTCQTSPTANNLIIGTDGKTYVIDFDNARADLRIYDLGRMLIRHSGWEVDKALFLIESYQEANPLTQEEIALLPGLCAFPSRGWRVARSFFERGKIHLARLEASIEELMKQEAFVKALSQIQTARLVHIPVQLFQTIPYPEPLIDDVVPEETEADKQPEPEVAQDVLPEQSESSPVTQVQQPFYWGDEHLIFDELEEEQLWALRQELASLARRLATISGAVFGQESEGGDGWVDTRHVPDIGQDDTKLADIVIEMGSEIPVEVSKGQSEETLAIPVSAEIGECLLGEGEEVEIGQSMADFGSRWQEEGEVRLDLAIDMENVSWEVPIEETMFSAEDQGGAKQIQTIPVLAEMQPEELIKPGKEVPVEYAVGFAADWPEDSVSSDQHQVIETASREDEAVGSEADVVVSLVPQETALEPLIFDMPADTVQFAEVIGQPAEAVPVFEEETGSEVWEAAAPAAQEAPTLEPETEIGPAQETEGTMMAQSDHEPERASPLLSPQPPTGTVEWGNFPEPLGGRRRARQRQSR